MKGNKIKKINDSKYNNVLFIFIFRYNKYSKNYIITDNEDYVKSYIYK